MSIEVKVVDEYPKEVFDDLVKRNLENYGIFIKERGYYGEGDESFSLTRKVIKVAAFDGEKMVGLSSGAAETKNRFHMHMSLVEKDYRGRGIYQKMLEKVLEHTKEFDEVDSCHHIHNNNILSIKLRKGFNIVGIETSIFIGQLIRLRYYNNKKLEEVMSYRVGLQERPEHSFYSH